MRLQIERFMYIFYSRDLGSNLLFKCSARNPGQWVIAGTLQPGKDGANWDEPLNTEMAHL